MLEADGLLPLNTVAPTLRVAGQLMVVQLAVMIVCQAVIVMACSEVEAEVELLLSAREIKVEPTSAGVVLVIAAVVAAVALVQEIQIMSTMVIVDMRVQ